MKLMIVSLILMLAIVGDFTSEVFASDHVDATCQVSVCEQVDFHASEQTDPSGHKPQDFHCHCHSGHLHVGVFFQSSIYSIPNSEINDYSTYGFLNFSTQEYFSEINRPPIV